MRQLTRIFLMLIVATMTAGLLTGSSCDNGAGPKDKGSVVGTWQMVRIVMHDTPVGELKLNAEQFLGMSGTDAKASVLQFNEDGSASVTTTYTDDSQDVIEGTWHLDGDDLTVDGAGIDDTVAYDVDGDTLTLTITMAIDFASDGNAEDIDIDMIYTKI